MLNNWNELDEVIARIKKKIDFIPTSNNELLKTTSIKDNQEDIFVWLGFLDVNVFIILGLMVLIGIINMGSALLVLILIRANFIGMMKAMGATNWSIRKIFLIQATFLISRGMLWGNVIGLGICLIQSQFGLFTLNPEVYYLSKVPIELSFTHWLLLNLGTLIICVISLIVPSVVITRIKPVKAIKFN
jgi:lipoprotein-releasing system permease protein